MCAKLFSLFVKTLRYNLPRHPVRSGLQIRHTTSLDMASADKDSVEKEEYDIIAHKNLTRFKKRYVKRQWEDPHPNWKENGGSEPKKTCERIKRKKMAMLLGYSGVNYYGMQRNPGVPTIEEDLLKALFECKYITEDDFNNQQSAQFQRSSRTDKGVSAARQVVSLKLPLEVDVEEINKRLPETIKVFGVKRVTNKFNSKSKCNARTYSYTLPTYVFEPSLVEEEERKQYRITPEKLQQITDTLAVYKGTKSYHNFTEKKHFQDPSASRYMMSFIVEKVFVNSDMEFAVLLVKGQSFMLHQIRKMIGLMIAVIRGHAEPSVMEKVFLKDKVMIPTAPGLGLVLDKVHYERYDAKFKNSHDSLAWDELEETIQKFKHEHIYPNIVKGEIEGNMSSWLEKLSLHSYEPSEDDRNYEKVAGDEHGDDDDDDGDDNDESEKVDGKSEEVDGNSEKVDGKSEEVDGKSEEVSNKTVNNDEQVDKNGEKAVADDVNSDEKTQSETKLVTEEVAKTDQ